MTIAKLAYLTSPAPNRYVINIQAFGSDDLLRFEIAKAHLANIVIDGTALALRENRVSETNNAGEAHERTDNGTQRTA
jgi:hypothetical protein